MSDGAITLRTLVRNRDNSGLIKPVCDWQHSEKRLNNSLGVPANNLLISGRVPANNFLDAGRVPANNFLFARRVPAKKLFLKAMVANWHSPALT